MPPPGDTLPRAWQATSTNLLESATSPLWQLRSLQHVTINSSLNSVGWSLQLLTDLLDRLHRSFPNLRTIKLCCLLEGARIPWHTVRGAARMASTIIINSREGMRWVREGTVVVPTERWEVLFVSRTRTQNPRPFSSQKEEVFRAHAFPRSSQVGHVLGTLSRNIHPS